MHCTVKVFLTLLSTVKFAYVLLKAEGAELISRPQMQPLALYDSSWRHFGKGTVNLSIRQVILKNDEASLKGAFILHRERVNSTIESHTDIKCETHSKP